MRKRILVLGVLLLAGPVVAADWVFYGSERMATFYVDRD